MRSAGLGAGFALTLLGLVSLWGWYANRPKPPKPWDKHAITAEYDYVDAQGEKNNITFVYTLQNNTDFDYRVDGDSGIDITAKLKEGKKFSPFAGHYITTEYPIFVPARNRVRCTLSIPYHYPGRKRDASIAEERKQFRFEVAKYVSDTFTNLDGFVLFDTGNRYQIDFSDGWGEYVSKEAPAQPLSP